MFSANNINNSAFAANDDLVSAGNPAVDSKPAFAPGFVEIIDGAAPVVELTIEEEYDRRVAAEAEAKATKDAEIAAKKKAAFLKRNAKDIAAKDSEALAEQMRLQRLTAPTPSDTAKVEICRGCLAAAQKEHSDAVAKGTPIQDRFLRKKALCKELRPDAKDAYAKRAAAQTVFDDIVRAAQIELDEILASTEPAIAPYEKERAKCHSLKEQFGDAKDDVCDRGEKIAVCVAELEYWLGNNSANAPDVIEHNRTVGAKAPRTVVDSIDLGIAPALLQAVATIGGDGKGNLTENLFYTAVSEDFMIEGVAKLTEMLPAGVIAFFKSQFRFPDDTKGKRVFSATELLTVAGFPAEYAEKLVAAKPVSARSAKKSKASPSTSQ